jgi:hypothetical protein
MAKTASLNSGLVAVKGHAAPAVTHVHTPRTTEKPTGPDYYKALTVKLDRDRYESLKNLGLKLDKKSQQIFTEALDLWIKKEAASAGASQ